MPLPISIHAPHEGERRIESAQSWHEMIISIHAPHEGERRLSSLRVASYLSYFNPRSPRGGATARFPYTTVSKYYFNPRSPRGGATVLQHERFGRRANFNPRSPRGGATRFAHRPQAPCLISIHAPHEGERRPRYIARWHNYAISIHAPHEGERHVTRDKSLTIRSLFQSTLPTRGSDIFAAPDFGQRQKFQSTLPTRGSDPMQKGSPAEALISIHAPHEGERLDIMA